jgi:hypothetical protein
MYQPKKKPKEDTGKVRRCPECGAVLPESYFYGPSGHCNECNILERKRRDHFIKVNDEQIY